MSLSDSWFGNKSLWPAARGLVQESSNENDPHAAPYASKWVGNERRSWPVLNIRHHAMSLKYTDRKEFLG
jgi:hypothetical protein